MLNAIAMVIILILDQAMKYWTILNIAENASAKPLIPGVVELVNVHNTGAAFSFLPDGRWFFIALTVVVAIVIIVLLSRDIVTGRLARFSLLAILAGGIGNCIDRVMSGYVVDMFNLQFMNFAVFNIADIFVTVFGVIFCICLITGKAVDKEEASAVFRGSRPDTRERVDYITQLKKPTVEGREAIETELAARKAAPQPTAVQRADDFGAWNIPAEPEASLVKSEPAEAPTPEAVEDEFAELARKRPAAPAPRPTAPEPLGRTPAPRSAPSAPAAPSTKTTVFDDPFKEAAKAPKKDGEFSLDDIIAEFKD